MANPQVQTVGTAADKAKITGSVVLVVAALAAYYLLSRQGALAQWVALLVLLVAAAGLFLTAEPGRSLVGFGRDAVREVKKVVWPTRKEAVQMTLYVFAFAVVMAIFLWCADKILQWVVYSVILGWAS